MTLISVLSILPDMVFNTLGILGWRSSSFAHNDVLVVRPYLGLNFRKHQCFELSGYITVVDKDSQIIVSRILGDNCMSGKKKTL